MGLSVSPDIFQEKMSELMVGLEFAQNTLMIYSSFQMNKALKLEQVLTRLQAEGLNKHE